MSNVKASAAPTIKSLPPTTEAFAEHVQRAHNQAAIWTAALFPDPPDLDFTHCGWAQDGTGAALVYIPVTVYNIIITLH